MKKWVHLIVSLVLFAVLLLAHGTVVHDALATLPDAALATVMPPVSVQAFSGLDAPVSPVLAQDGYAELESVTAYYTTADAPALFGLTMQYGEFAPWEDDNIVIGSELAAALFLTEDAVGQTVSFNGREYTVCGVYRQQDSLLARVSQTPAPAVFLPLAAYPDQNVMIGDILVGFVDAPSTASVEAVLETQLGVQMTCRSAYHFGETRRLVRQGEDLLGLLLALAFCILSAWWVVQRVLRFVKAAKADTGRAVLTGHMREAMLCVAALVCLAAGVFWLSRSAFTLFLPLDFVTRDGSIVDYVIGNAQLVNLKADIFLCEFSSHVKTILTVLDLCIVVMLLKIACRVKRTIKNL